MIHSFIYLITVQYLQELALPKLLSSLHNSEPFVVFSGGLSYDKAGRRPTLTIMHGKAITVLEMDYPIVEFMVLCETPYNNGKCLGSAVVPHIFWLQLSGLRSFDVSMYVSMIFLLLYQYNRGWCHVKSKRMEIVN